MAATGLLIDAAWNIVSAVTGAPVEASATPYAYVATILKSLMTAMLTPGTLCCFSSDCTTAASETRPTGGGGVCAVCAGRRWTTATAITRAIAAAATTDVRFMGVV